MGYYVRSVKRQGRPWSVLYRETVGKKRAARTLRDDELGMHSFSPGMTLEQAKKRASDLNKDAETKLYTRRKMEASEKVRVAKLKVSLLFSDEPEFLEWLEKKQGIEIEGTKLMSHWFCAQSLIKDLGLKPSEYADSKLRVYRWFREEKRRFSFDYCVKVIRLLNLYGKFHARTYNTFFEPLAPPTGMHKADIHNAHLKKKARSKKAKPLTPAHLVILHAKLPAAQYNWMHLSLWLGLRPLEVDHLKDSQFFRWETGPEGLWVLWVMQTKLRGLNDEDKWKPIPLHEEEQKLCKAIIDSGEFERPLPKTLEKYLGVGFKPYSGRKGFEHLMVTERKHEFVKVSQWMGHQSLDRTWKDYADKLKVRY